MRVVCYAGRKADERPIRFYLDGREYLVEDVVDQWYGPADTFFKYAQATGTCTSCGAGGTNKNGAWSRSAERECASRHAPALVPAAESGLGWVRVNTVHLTSLTRALKLIRRVRPLSRGRKL